MNASSKNKWLIWLVILLLIANAATLTVFWVKKPKPPPPHQESPAEFLAQELNLGADQKEKLHTLINEHRHAAEVLRVKLREAKDQFFDLLKQPGVTDSSKNAAAQTASRITEQLDLLTFDHFLKVRALCDPAQQKRFDEIIHQVTSMMAPPRPMGPGGPPPGPPGANGPPPQF